MSDIIVSVIVVGIVTMIITRPGAATAIRQLSGYMSSSIKALLGAD